MFCNSLLCEKVETIREFTFIWKCMHELFFFSLFSNPFSSCHTCGLVCKLKEGKELGVLIVDPFFFFWFIVDSWLSLHKYLVNGLFIHAVDVWTMLEMCAKEGKEPGFWRLTFFACISCWFIVWRRDSGLQVVRCRILLPLISPGVLRWMVVAFFYPYTEVLQDHSLWKFCLALWLVKTYATLSMSSKKKIFSCHRLKLIPST